MKFAILLIHTFLRSDWFLCSHEDDERCIDWRVTRRHVATPKSLTINCTGHPNRRRWAGAHWNWPALPRQPVCLYFVSANPIQWAIVAISSVDFWLTEWSIPLGIGRYTHTHTVPHPSLSLSSLSSSSSIISFFFLSHPTNSTINLISIASLVPCTLFNQTSIQKPPSNSIWPNQTSYS